MLAGKLFRLYQPELVNDLPADRRRFVQRLDGYVATFLAGMPTFERGEHTGALPGRLCAPGMRKAQGIAFLRQRFPHSAFAPTARTSLPKRSVSEAMKAAKCPGVVACTSAP
jgi:hypothetical protein